MAYKTKEINLPRHSAQKWLATNDILSHASGRINLYGFRSENNFISL